MQIPVMRDGKKDASLGAHGGDTARMALYFVRRYPIRAFMMVTCICMAGLTDGFGISLFLPLIQIVSKGNQVAESGLSRVVSSLFARIGIEPQLGPILAIIVLAMAFKGMLSWLAMNQAGYTIARVANDLRMDLIGALLKARWGYFVDQPAGQVANAFAAEALKASRAYQNAAVTTACIVQMIVYTSMAILVSWQVASMALITGALILVVLNRLIGLSRKAGKNQVGLLKSLTGRLVDAINGIKPMKAMSQENRLLPMFEVETLALNKAQRQEVFASVTVSTSQEPMMAAIMACGLYFIVKFTSVQFASLLVLAFLFSRIVAQVNSMTQNYQQLVTCESAFWSLRNRIQAVESERERNDGKTTISGLRHGITFNNVKFGYGGKMVLDDVSFAIPAGKWIGIVGASGSGKTTIIDLLAGLYSPQSGQILADGLSLREMDISSWRRLIGYVPQEMFLFYDTIRNNIVLGDDSISRLDVEMALREAGAWEFVKELPEGMDTFVGERGARFSGGQRQRIAIARALVRKPAILILDEVTASLDPEAEAGICSTLFQLKGKVAIVSVSHQQALISAANAVYRLDRGRITPITDSPRDTTRT